MPPFETIELRGIFSDNPKMIHRVRLFVKQLPDKDVDTFEIANTTILNRGRIIQAVRDHYSDVHLKVDIPKWILRQLKPDQESEDV